VPAYRDPIRPEVVHYPGSLGTKILLTLILAVSVGLLAAVFEFEEKVEWIWQVPLLLAVIGLCLWAWPFELRTTEYGVEQRGLLRHHRIPYAALGKVEIGGELRLFSPTPRRGGLTTACIRLIDKSGRRRLKHTTRHEDPERLLKELKRRGAPEPTGRIPEAAEDIQEP
jgi:hypothetical protein